MRHCVLRHHVCLCVLSTAMLAGFALLTEQREVYAQSNCEPVARDGGEAKERIECNGSNNTTGTVAGNRTIDMGTEASEPAVKVYKSGRGGKDIRITGDVLKITGSGSNKNPAIKVYSEGVLTVNNVTMTDVHKGIEVGTGGGKVTVIEGMITIRPGGDSVIDVKNGGTVTLNDGVKTVTGGGGAESTGIVVGEGGGNVTVMGTSFSNVKMGIKFTGTGKANVSGGAERATMTVTGTGIMMEGTGGANVMSMTVKGQNSGTGVDMKNGMLTVTGKSTIKGSTMGVSVEGGKFVASMSKGGKIEVTNGTGLSVTGAGIANVMNAMITGAIGGSGGGETGVEVNTSKTVTLTNVEVSGFKTGISVMKGTVTVSGESKIMGKSVGVEVSNGMLEVTGKSRIEGTTMGVSVTGSGKFVAVMNEGGKIEVTERNGVGLKVTGEGSANVMNAMITTSGRSGGKTGVEAGGKEVTLTGVKIEKFETGISVTSGEVTVMGKSTIKGTTMGVEVKGGKLTVMGGSIIQVEADGTGVGLKVEKTGTANVTNAAIMASGRGGIGQGTGVESSGTVELNKVVVSGFEKGAIVSDGRLEVNGGSTITGKSMGVEVKENGEFEMGGSSGIQVEGGTGVGLKVMDQGTANVMNSAITAQGGSGTGKIGVESSGTVTLMNVGISEFKTGISVQNGTVTMTKVEISQVDKGVNMTSGTFKMTRGSITGENKGYGVYALGGNATLEGVTVSNFATGVYMEKGTLKISGGKISGVTAGVYMTGAGSLTMTGGTEIELASVGVDMTNAGSLTVNGSTIMVTVSGGTGVEVNTSGRVTLNEVVIEKGVVYDGSWDVDDDKGVDKRVYGVWGLGRKGEEC